MHVPKSHPIVVTKDLIKCMITGFDQKHFQKQLPNIVAGKEINRRVSRSWPTDEPTKTVIAIDIVAYSFKVNQTTILTCKMCPGLL